MMSASSDNEIATDPFSLTERIASLLGRPRLGKFASWVLRLRGIDLPNSLSIGPRLRLPHGAVGLVVHPSTKLGADVMLFQGVTIGRSDQYLSRAQSEPGGGVVVGDRVVVGAGAGVFFRSGCELTIGDDAVIGAGSVLLRCVPSGEIWAGNPARKVGEVPGGRRQI